MCKTNMIKKQEHIKLNRRKTTAVFKAVNEAIQNRRGIFYQGLKPFLPQWNLPPEFEYIPQRKETIDPINASKYLFTRTFCDRLAVSSYLSKQTQQAWADKETRWIFFPDSVTKRSIEEIRSVLKDKLKHAIYNNQEKSPWEKYSLACKILMEKYQGDSRNLIHEKTVEKARIELMSLPGFGTGLANLYIMEMYSRRIAIPTDPENIKSKIDVHKARLALNTDILELVNNTRERGEVHANGITSILEREYLRVCKKQEIDQVEIDAALWIIGSEICTRKDYNYCRNCPLVDGLCISDVRLNRFTDRFEVYKKGERIDIRKNLGQKYLKL